MSTNVQNRLVVIPTYNECENIAQLIAEILPLDDSLHVLVVDDNSPDGTAQIVQKIATGSERVHLLLREHKQGLGRAYVAGFAWGLKAGYATLIEMDADFSHRPLDLKKIVDRLTESDFIVGSRYVAGGSIKNWGLIRKMISVGGSLYARIILGYPIRDWTGGLNAWHRRVLEGIDIQNVGSDGYCFQIELKYRALKKGYKGIEVPILFTERLFGQSKMSLKIVLEAVYKVWVLRFWV